MARIAEEELARLKAVPLLDLCREYGIELRAQGRDYSGRCPFHEDASPSFIVSPGKNLWNCLGACGCGGDTIQLVMKREVISFRHACEKLRGRLGGAAAAAPAGAGRGLLAPLEAEAGDGDLLGQVAGVYHKSFLDEPAAMTYLSSRACFHPEAAKLFQLGYANRTLGYRVPAATPAGPSALRARLQALGVLRADTGHEHLNGCVVFPITDTAGQVVQLYGRRLGASSLRHLYLPGPQRGVWNSPGLLPGADWLLCEALIDALTFWCHGWKAVTSSYGVNGFTAAHAALIAERRPGRVVLCYDADTAGHAQAEALARELAALGTAVWRAAIPEGKDINDLAREAVEPAAALRVAVSGAKKMAGPVTVAASAGAPEGSVSCAPAPSSLAAGAAKEKAAEPGTVTVVKAGETEVVLACETRTYRVRGLCRNAGYEALKVSLRLTCKNAWHLDTLDLAQARQRAAFVAAAAEETGLSPDLLKREVGQVLLKLEEVLEDHLRAQVAPESAPVPMTPAEEQEALALLRDPRLLERIAQDFAACGVVGEESNALVGYLAAVSRKLKTPLAVVVQSTSAAGKTALMEAVLAFMPPEERIKYSALTGQALFYLSEANLKHKILAIVEEEGAEKASYALKLLQSEGELTIAATGKDPQSGRMVTQEYRVEGPVMIFLTTTAVDIDEELLNRCLVLTVDEGRAQTAAIHRMQRERETLQGLLRAETRAAILGVHRNAQRLLRPLRVVNPFAEQLTFMDERTRTRRDHMKYLCLIRTIALLHQHQRPVRTVMGKEDGQPLEYIEVTLADIAAANRLAHEVLGRCLDELAPQTRRVLSVIEGMVAGRCTEEGAKRADILFSRRQLREFSGLGDTQLRVHLERLVQLEYLITHRGRMGQTFVYELVYDGAGKDGRKFLTGLLDVERLSGASLAGVNSDLAGASRAMRGPFAAGSRGGGAAAFPSGNPSPMISGPENAHQAGAVDAA